MIARVTLSPAQLDRVSGTLLGQACGDALGVPYEFQRPLGPGVQAEMIGGGLGPYEPGEYSDDTQMAACIARVAAGGVDLTDESALDDVAENFLDWLRSGATDVGSQTSQVLGPAARGGGDPAARLRKLAAALHERTGKTAGNGALMRTSPVALAHLDDRAALVESARAVAELTHADPLAGDACVLWCAGIAHAITDGTFDGVRSGLDLLPAERRDQWAGWLTDAEHGPPGLFNPNGFTVPALQAAYAAVLSIPVPDADPGTGSFPCLHLQHALQAAVHVGNDTDTVAAIAGGLLGARWGVSAIPLAWQRVVHGWPALRARDLIRLAMLTVNGGQSDSQGWPQGDRLDYQVPAVPAVPHPADHEVLLGGIEATGAQVDAVVSLCRLGREQVPAPGVAAGDHVEVRLIDTPKLADNANLEFAIDDAARTVKSLRHEGKRVLLHCVQAQSRTPTVAARYATLLGIPPAEALDSVLQALSGSHPNDAFRAALHRLGELADSPTPGVGDVLAVPQAIAPHRVIAASWWLAGELVRRHPELMVIETHPGGGKYDCLGIYVGRVATATDHIQLNREGSAHCHVGDAHESWRTVWADHLASEDPHMAVRKLEQMAHLAAPSPTPPTRAAALVYRLIARLLAMHVDDRSRWDCRNGMIDSGAGVWERRPELAAFPTARERLSRHKASDPLGEPAYRFWILLRGDEPVALFENTGFAYVDGQALDLRTIYHTHHRLFPVLNQAFGSFLP